MNSSNEFWYTLIVPRADMTGPTNFAVDLADQAVRHGWKVRVLFLSGNIDRQCISVVEEMRKFRLSDILLVKGIVHSHGLRPDLLAWLFTFKKNCFVLSTLHGHYPQHLEFDYNKWLVKCVWVVWAKALSRFNSLVCISNSMLEFYKKRFKDNQLQVVYNCCQNKKDISPPSRKLLAFLTENKHERRVIIVYAGSLSERKNVRNLVSAVIRSPSIALVVCGEGPEKETILDLIRKSSATSRIYLAGFSINVQRIIAMGDLFVLPSYAEGMPIVVLEAACQGKPSLMSDINVHRELAKLGIGNTFDHKTFHCFEDKVWSIAKTRSTEKEQLIRYVWSQKFSPEIAFNQYKVLLERYLQHSIPS